MIKGYIAGQISELIAQKYFVENGCKVSKPIQECCDYDLVIDYKNTLLRVQVKSIYWDSSREKYVCNLLNAHRISTNDDNIKKHKIKKYDKNSFDILCAVERDSNIIYIIPIKYILGRSRLIFYPFEKPKKISNKLVNLEKFKLENNFFSLINDTLLV